MTPTVGDLVRDGERTLTGSTSPRLDAQLLVGHVLDRDRAWIVAHPETPLDGAQFACFSELLGRRREGAPLAYLRGHVEWFGIELEVTPAVLVPRPDTETLAESAIALAKATGAGAIADVGTGSGAIAIALATGLPGTSVIASDVSDAALDVARRNIERHNVSDRIRLMQGDLLAAVPDGIDLIVANLPYLSTERMEAASADVRSEPGQALAGGPDGLDLYRRLAAQLTHRDLRIPVVIEIDPGQARAALQLFAATHRTVRSIPDLSGRDRVIVATP